MFSLIQYMQKFKFLEHTADIKFQAFGNSLEKTFENSALALKESITEKIKIKPLIEKNINIKGEDLPSLLYNFLEEFLFLLDSESFLFSKIQEIKIDQKNLILKAIVLGDKAENYDFSNNVKAITYNDIFVKKQGKEWIAQIVIDV